MMRYLVTGPKEFPNDYEVFSIHRTLEGAKTYIRNVSTIEFIGIGVGTENCRLEPLLAKKFFIRKADITTKDSLLEGDF